MSEALVYSELTFDEESMTAWSEEDRGSWLENERPRLWDGSSRR